MAADGDSRRGRGPRRRPATGGGPGRHHPAAREWTSSWPAPEASDAVPALPTGTVTFLFTDVEGSTPLWEGAPEAMRVATARHDALIETHTRAHGGVVVRPRGEGDSRFCVFARATDAVAAAAAIQRALHEEPWPAAAPLRVRLALHTGEADVRDGDYYGSAVNRAARLRGVAYGGQALLSQATYDLVREALPAGVAVRDLGEHRLVGLAQPERVYQLLAPGAPAHFPPLRSSGALLHNLPVQLTSFVGRERELAEVGRLLATHRLVTLTGPGGVGKTRLALQVATDLIDDFAGGVFFVPLAAVSDPGLVASAIARALGVRELEGRAVLDGLRDHLREKALLLVLDNFEHLLNAAPLVADLLAGCRGMKVLATSRAALRLSSECEYRVAPLELPDPRHPPAEGLMRYDAIRLFGERAQAGRSDFTVTDQNAAAVAEICARLDGLPLALELAAARVRHLPPQTLNAYLAARRLPLLTAGPRDLPSRQHTMRATIAWSHDLLDAQERTLFRRLAVFADSWTLPAAAAVCEVAEGAHDRPSLGPGALDVLDGMMALVDKSLVQPGQEAVDEPRFRMLEMVREFALERLEEAGELGRLRQAHASYYVTLAEAGAPGRDGAAIDHGGVPPSWLGRLERDLGNFRSALQWWVEQGDAEPALRLACALAPFWYTRGYWTEGRGWLSSVLALPGTGAHTRLLAEALSWAGTLARAHSDYHSAQAFHEQALRIQREHGDRAGAAASLGSLALVAYFLGDLDRTRALVEDCLTLWGEVGDARSRAAALRDFGNMYLRQGDPVTAQPLLEEGLAIARNVGDYRGMAEALSGLSYAARAHSDYAAARALLTEGVALWRVAGDQAELAAALTSLGLLDRWQGDLLAAHAHFAESLSLARAAGNRRATVEALCNLGMVTAILGNQATGRALLEEGLTLARGGDNHLSIATALNALGWLACHQGDYDTARAWFGEQLARARQLQTKRGVAWALQNLGNAARWQGDSREAIARLEECLALYREFGGKENIAWVLLDLGHAAQDGGDARRAAACFEESLRLQREIGKPRGIAACLAGLARTAATERRPERAGRLFGAAEALLEAIGLVMEPADRAQYERQVAAARAALVQAGHGATFELAWAEGEAMSLEEAVADALDEPPGA